MKNFLTQHKTGVSIGVILFVFVPLTYFLSGYFLKSINEKKNAIKELSVTQEIRHEQLNQITTFAQQEELIRAERSIVNVFMVNEDDAKVALAKKIEDVAATTETSVDITAQRARSTVIQKKRSAQVAEEGKKDDKKDAQSQSAPEENSFAPAQDDFLELKIALEGRYVNILNFLYKVENMQYFSDVLEVTIERKKENSVQRFNTKSKEADPESVEKQQDDLLSANFTIVFYFTPSDVTQGDGGE